MNNRAGTQQTTPTTHSKLETALNDPKSDI